MAHGPFYWSSFLTVPLPLPQAHAKLQVDNEVLGEELKQLQSRSEDIIATLQKERDRAIAECEEQRSQVRSLLWGGASPPPPALHRLSRPLGVGGGQVPPPPPPQPCFASHTLLVLLVGPK